MATELNRMLLARDVYKSWKRRVQQAELSVRVFTPYFDRALDRLLGNASPELGEISVVTDLSPASGALDYRGQLLGARSLLRRDIEVRSLPRLHAKVLLCDGEQVTIGSQNFTSYGRGSNETTALIDDDVSGTSFAVTLDEWYAAATPVSLEFVERLLTDLADAAEAAKQARDQLTDAFHEQWEEYLAKLEEERRAREAAARRKPIAVQLARAVRVSTDRHAREKVWAKLRPAGEVDVYETLLADKDSSLTWWRTRQSNGGIAFTTLTRLNFYPIILNPAGRMAFGRIAQTRITYVRSSVKWTRPRELFGRMYNLTVRFPGTGLELVNIEMSLTVTGEPEYASLELGLRYDGLEVTLERSEVRAARRSSTFAATYVTRQTRLLEKLAGMLQDATNLDKLLAGAFATFTYSELGVGNRNATEFFPRGWVRVTMIEFAERPVLVVTPHAG
jgi:hypothetical protein